MPSTPLTTGAVFAGDFRVERLLADGGMGSVYVVEQLSTGKRRALKVMHPRMLHDPALRERFTQEARLGAKIASDHVVEVVGAGLDAETGIPWMAMELLQGRDLSVALAEHGPYALGEAQQIFRQVGHAMSRAHRLGIVHRDLKPENLFLASARSESTGETVKILDFGIAKVMQETRATGATIGGLGTPLWMAPEQTHGGVITPATDVWALGLIGFALLAGRSYWKSATGDLPLQVVLTEMVAAPMPTASERVAELGLGVTLPPGFDAWFAQCVSREASERFVHAESCVAAFLALRAAEVAVAPTLVAAAIPATAVRGTTQLGAASVPAPRGRPRARAWTPAVVAAAVLVPALAFGTWMATRPAAVTPLAAVTPTPVRTESRGAIEAPPAEAPPVEAPRRGVDPPPPIAAHVPVARAPTAPRPTAHVPAPSVVARPASPPPSPVVPPPPAPPPMEPAPAVEPPRVAVPLRRPPRSWRGRPERPRFDPRPDEPAEVPAYSAVRERPRPMEPAPVAPIAPAYMPPPVARPASPQPPPPSRPTNACGACQQGATERCNGCDDNCNGIVDEGC